MDQTTAARTRARRASAGADTIDVGRRLDAQTAKRFARSMTKLIESGRRECIIDMTATSAVDSSGFGSLVAAIRKIADVGGVTAIVCLDDTVRRLFEVAGITRLAPVVSRVEDARAIMSAYSRSALAS